ncbi:MAG: UPF0272 protein [Planctomycetota bacterium]|nr:MAG: UPF0272 protein [Planctomycetota bacterium]
MSRHLHLDLVGGIAGDMSVAALCDAGVDSQELTTLLERSGLPRAELAWERVWRGGIAGLAFNVGVEADAPHRNWADIRALLEAATLPEGARQRALEVFALLARAEADTHGCSVDEVHFHEVGALDSIVDIVAASLALDLLRVTSASCSSVPVCPGAQGHMAHGELPLPAPATARLLRGFTLRPIPGTLETVTPTGAALLAQLCPEGGSAMPEMRLLATGTGLGTAELSGRPNALRVLLGERVTQAPAPHEGTSDGHAVVLEANIDDMDPRVFGEACALLFEAGALDVALLPLQMKKQRPGTLLQVVARPELEGVLTGVMLRETTTLGVRSHDVRRTELARRFETVRTPFGEIRLKRGFLGEQCLNVSPEYDDCAARAREHGVPVKEVLAAALSAGFALESAGE